jgi:hypothetical protein
MAKENTWEGFRQIKEGDTEKTKIIEVKHGILSDFKSKEYFEKIESDKREPARKQAAVQVLCENGMKIDIIMPRDKTFGPRSVLASWERTYHKLPEVGDEVTAERDELGFWRVSLKQLR